MTTDTPTSASTPGSSPDPAPAATPARGSRLTTLMLVGVMGLVALVGLGAVARNLLTPHLYAGTVLQSDEPAPSLAELTLADGSPVELGAFRDEVVLVFFGYTNCPDVCPQTMSEVTRALDELSTDDRERVNLIMVSVDPRDQPEDLQAYLEFFDPAFVGASGPTEAIDRAASAYGVYYELGEPDQDGSYTVDHTGTLMGIGPSGALRVVWSPGTRPEALAADLHALLS